MTDGLGTLAIAAPTFIYLAATWRQEFPYSGDQSYHNGEGAEAFALLWPWWWIAGAIAIVAVVVCARRGFRYAPPIALVIAAVAGLAFHHPYSFAARYPGTLHVLAAPLRALPLASPMNAERLLNAASIPVWLLVLRPRLLGRNVDLFALAAGALLLWQKDDVYYFTSGYLEPWAIVLVLTAAEHLVRFGREEIWRPLLLLGAAAMVKEHVVIALPVVAVVFFHKALLPYAASAIAPFFLFSRLRALFRPWSATAPDFAAAIAPARLAEYAQRIEVQFGIAGLIVVALALIALAVLATRSRPFLALFSIAFADATFFLFARVMHFWPGTPRLNMVWLAMAAIAAGFVAERARSLAIVLLIVIANAIPLAPFVRDAFRPDTARNFVEHSDAPVFYPLREALSGVKPGERVAFLNNGKWMFETFYPGPIGEQYTDLLSRVDVISFKGAPERCRCTAGHAAVFAGFIRFTNLGATLPQRAAIEAEAARCREELERSCGRTRAIVHEGVLTGVVGQAR